MSKYRFLMLNDMPAYDLTSLIIASAIEVHRELGPGLFEIAYEECLAAELLGKGLTFQRQIVRPLVYKKLRLAKCYKIDIVVENRVLLELKAVRNVTATDSAQVLTYLKLSGLEVGLLINFNSMPLKSGITRFVRTNPSPALPAPSQFPAPSA